MSGRAKTVKRFERSNGLDTAQYKNYLYLFLSCLEVECPSDFDEADAKLIDGANMVDFFRPDASIKSFRDYADKKVIPYISRGSWPTLNKLLSSGTAICQTV